MGKKRDTEVERGKEEEREGGRKERFFTKRIKEEGWGERGREGKREKRRKEEKGKEEEKEKMMGQEGKFLESVWGSVCVYNVILSQRLD